MAGTKQPTKREEIILTEEEKQVLLQCRRGALTRGLLAGITGTMGFRLLVRSGHLPRHVTGLSGIYTVGIFLLTSSIGMSSYRQVCIDKLMALDNSRIADKIREYREQTLHNDCKSKDWQPPRQKQADKLLDEKEFSLDQLPSTPSTKAGPDTPTTQPDAFGALATSDDGKDKKVRTFDEIREEHRKHSPSSYRHHPREADSRTTRDTGTGTRRDGSQDGSAKPVQRNKYGDIIYED